MQGSRRNFLKTAAVTVATLANLDRIGNAADVKEAKSLDAAGAGPQPWYRRVVRWGQTNITELDPTRYDIAWWRDYWKRTQVQGVIINAGGIVAYYPSAIPLHHRAQFLGDRDLFGELTRAAHEDGLAVFARMDSNSAHEDFHRAHPDWFAVDANGRPYRNRELYVSCVNSPYYDEHIPAVLREIATRYRPEGFTDNSWSGLGRNSICFCPHCERKFRERTGQPIPRTRNWNDRVYRDWIEWNYARRLEIWDQNNRVTRAAGGPDCVWVGMNGGEITGQAHQFRDFKAIAERAEIIMLDDQRRNNDTGFQRNGHVGKLVHGLLGWDKVLPESMAMYQTSAPTFRLTSKPEPETRMWMLEGFAGGIQPWWHHVGAFQDDRRQFSTVEPIMRWHRENESYLVNRLPIATVGVVWSQRNTDFFGRDDPELLVDLPWQGVMQALIRARIPYLPVNADHIERDAAQFRVLILPNLAVVSDVQLAALRRFVERGGGLVATGQSTLCDQWGDARPDFGLADLFGAHLPERHGMRDEATRRRWANESSHSYLRISPTLHAHVIFSGFADTDILPFGGSLEPLTLDPGTQVFATFIPSFPAFPPELSWMRTPTTELPALIVNEKRNAGRVAFLPADLDRRYARDHLPDHANLLANLVRWAARDEIPLAVDGPGLIDCHLYRQPGRLILHLVNLTSAGTWRAPVEELIPVGPLKIRVPLKDNRLFRRARLLTIGELNGFDRTAGQASFELKSILDHHVVVLE
jgi:hypothetical protein